MCAVVGRKQVEMVRYEMQVNGLQGDEGRLCWSWTIEQERGVTAKKIYNMVGLG